MNIEVDVDEMVEILEEDKPLCCWMVKEKGRDKLFFLTILPHLSDQVLDFAHQLLKEYENSGRIT